jgi:RimJ/RimL family protein N-acetyltransferase
MIYETDRIKIVPFSKEYANDNYMSWFMNKDITKFNSHGLGPMTIKQRDLFLETLYDGSKIVWAIIIKEYEDKLIHIGNISLQSINQIYQTAEFAILIGEKKYWGKGIGKEAGQLIINHGFNRLNMNRIWTGTAETNMGMRRLARALGMTREGVFRDGMYLNGEYTDIYTYAILKEEWKENEKNKRSKSKMDVEGVAGTENVSDS